MAKKNAAKQQQQLIDQDVKDVLEDTGIAQTNNILRTLNDISKKDAILVAKYVKEQTRQGFSNNYKSKCQVWACRLSDLCNHKDFKRIGKDDVECFFKYYNKGASLEQEERDPKHHWIGTYNQAIIHIPKFLKFVHYPDVWPPKARPRLDFIHFTKIRRKEEFVYDGDDMWTQEDDALFMKYCPSLRDVCFHMMMRDTSARPGELLNLKRRDIHFDAVYGPEIVVVGKTGKRTLGLFDSVPFIYKWLELHSYKSEDADIFYSQKTGRKLDAKSLANQYQTYKERFRELTVDSSIPEEDRVKLSKLIKK